MKKIGGIDFHSDYDEFNITETELDRVKLKLFNNLNMDVYIRLWNELEKKRSCT